jgi:S-DNA-T family DNA segregation ATPase FtsK/SpoIIIE
MESFNKKIEDLIDELNQNKEKINTNVSDIISIENNNENKLPYFLNVGKLRNSALELPFLIPFLESKGIVFSYDKNDENNIKFHIQTLLLNLVDKIFPFNIEISIYDPVNLGVSYNHLKKLASDNLTVDVLTEENKFQEKLNKYISSSRELIDKVLINHDSFVDYWNAKDDNGKDKYEDKSYSIFLTTDSQFVKNHTIVDLINRITANTKNNNSFFILLEEDSKVNAYSFFGTEYLIRNSSGFYKGLAIDLGFNKDAKEKEDYFTSTIQKIIQKNENKRHQNIEIYDIKDGIKIPIGKIANNNKLIQFDFGNQTDNYHAIIGGQSGKGKSVLLETIIKRACEKYNSSDLKFMLFDCKGSGDFNKLNPSEYILLRENSGDIQTIVEKLKGVEEEFLKRREIMKEHDVRDIKELRNKGIVLYRLVCIIDEFQNLFTASDYKIQNFAEELLVSKLLKQSRSLGIHLIVATQSLGDGVRSSILNNIPLRIALGMTEWQSSSFLASNNTAAKNLERGLAIYNNSNGELSANTLIKIDKVD